MLHLISILSLTNIYSFLFKNQLNVKFIPYCRLIKQHHLPSENYCISEGTKCTAVLWYDQSHFFTLTSLSLGLYANYNQRNLSKQNILGCYAFKMKYHYSPIGHMSHQLESLEQVTKILISIGKFCINTWVTRTCYIKSHFLSENPILHRFKMYMVI